MRLFRTLPLILLLLASCTSCMHHRVIEVAPQEEQYRGTAALKPSLLKRRGQVIFIDPGHGGRDFGTYSLTTPRTHEKVLTLATSRMVRDYLTKMGYKTVMSRNEDVFIELRDRVKHAHQVNASLFVSVHYNSAPNTSAHGIEVFYYQPKESSNRTHASENLATHILNRSLRYTAAKDRGVKHGNFAVIRETKIPAVLIEGGFLTNSDELAKLKRPDYLAQVAKGIAVGIDEYVQKTVR